MKRNIYVTEHVDAQRCRDWANENALKGDDTVIHFHAYETSCWMRDHEVVKGDDSGD